MTADAKGVSWLASVIIRHSSAFAAILPPYLLVVKEVGWWVQLVSQYVQCTSLVHPVLVNYPTSSKRFPQSSGEVNFFLFLLGGTVHTRMIKIQMKIIAYLCAFCSENSSIFSIGMSAPKTL